MEYYVAIINSELLLFVTTWMDPDGMMLSEINQIEKHKYCVESKNDKIKQKQTRRNRDLSDGYPRAGVGDE